VLTLRLDIRAIITAVMQPAVGHSLNDAIQQNSSMHVLLLRMIFSIPLLSEVV
jgi:hypothetical protein